MVGNRALYQDGWVAAVSWNADPEFDYAHDRWELYHGALSKVEIELR